VEFHSPLTILDTRGRSEAQLMYNMSDMMREMEIGTATPGPETLPGDVMFVEGALNEVGHAMGRYMDPTPIGSKLLDRESVSSDEKIAEILSYVKDDSPKIDPTTDQGIIEATQNMIGRAEAAIEQATDPDAKHRIEKFQNKNTRGVASYLTKPVNFGRRKFLKVATVGGFALILGACAPKIIGPVIITDGGGTSPTATEVSPTQTGSELKVNLSSPPESEEQEFFRGVIIDPEENRLWRMNEKDLEIVGNLQGEFQGWVDKSSIPRASKSENIRYGRWINSGGMGIVEFIEVKEGEYYGGMFIDENGGIWRMLDEDFSLVGTAPGTFDGWIEETSIPEDERAEGIRWGKWSSNEGQGVVRFEKVDLNQIQ